MRRLQSVLRHALVLNKTIAHAIEPHLPQRRLDLQRYYDEIVAGYAAALPEGGRIADIGCGRATSFARLLRRDAVVLIGVDQTEEALAENADVDERCLADVNTGLPFQESELALLTSRSVLEHLENTHSFFRDIERVLRPGGYSVHIFASKFAPFAVVNSLLPSRISRRLLEVLHPETRGDVGFPTRYDRTYASRIRRVAHDVGLDVVVLRVSYYQSGYYNFFLPMYLLSVLYELIVSAIGWEDLAAKVVIVVRKPPAMERDDESESVSGVCE